MKKIFQVSLLFCLMSAAFASTDFIPFTTIEQAQQYCPAINGLTFTANNPRNPNSSGSIGGNNRVVFTSFPSKMALHPKNMDSSGLITDAQFLFIGGCYGYIFNDVITCSYSYTAILGVQPALVLRSNSN